GQQDTSLNPEAVITIQRGPTIQEGGGLHPLHRAVLQGDLEAVGILLAKVDVNTPDSQGNTPLHLAILQDNLAAVTLLVEAKAAVDVKNAEGLVPLHMAVKQG